MTSDRFAAVEQHIREEMTRHHVPSFVGQAWQDGQVVWTCTLGLADRDLGLAADIHTSYLLASVTKPITATAIMMLCEQGKLDLDAPINDYLDPSAQIKVWIGDPRQATVRRVAAHTCGLPLHSNSYADKSMRPSGEVTVRRYGIVVAPPGERYCYSNIGYGILDHLIERVSGKTYHEFLRSDIFLPLGMTRSFVQGDPRMAGESATIYGSDGSASQVGETDHRGATVACCSVHDLLRFGLFHMGKPLPDQKNILSPEHRAAMQIPIAAMNPTSTSDPNVQPKSGYGIGWVIDDDEVGYRVSHAGGWGTCTKLVMLPRENIVLAAMTNSFCPLAHTIDNEILPVLIPDYAKRLSARTAVQEKAKASTASQERPVTELAGVWRGEVHTYQGTRPLIMDVKDNGDIHAKLGDQLWVLLNEAVLRGQRLTGKMQGTVDTTDAHLCPRYAFHHLRVDLTRRGDRLCGVIVAVVGRELGHWVDLKKDQP